MKEIGPVLAWPEDKLTDAVLFCPCGEREVYLANHKLAFDANDRLTVEPSILNEEWLFLDEDGEYSKRVARCHFFIRDGVAEMCEDSTCPKMRN